MYLFRVRNDLRRIFLSWNVISSSYWFVWVLVLIILKKKLKYFFEWGHKIQEFLFSINKVKFPGKVINEIGVSKKTHFGDLTDLKKKKFSCTPLNSSDQDASFKSKLKKIVFRLEKYSEGWNLNVFFGGFSWNKISDLLAWTGKSESHYVAYKIK